jgi:hypothetical protein
VGPNAGAEFNGCDILLQSDGVCEPLELNAFNPLVENSPFRSGNLFTVGLNVSGGNEQVQFFVSGERGVLPCRAAVWIGCQFPHLRG